MRQIETEAGARLRTSTVSFSVAGSTGDKYTCFFGPCFLPGDPVGPVLGVPVEVQLFRSGRYVGVGLVAFATFSSLRSFGGATVNLQLGRMR